MPRCLARSKMLGQVISAGSSIYSSLPVCGFRNTLPVMPFLSASSPVAMAILLTLVTAGSSEGTTLNRPSAAIARSASSSNAATTTGCRASRPEAARKASWRTWGTGKLSLNTWHAAPSASAVSGPSPWSGTYPPSRTACRWPQRCRPVHIGGGVVPQYRLAVDAQCREHQRRPNAGAVFACRAVEKHGFVAGQRQQLVKHGLVLGLKEARVGVHGAHQRLYAPGPGGQAVGRLGYLLGAAQVAHQGYVAALQGLQVGVGQLADVGRAVDVTPFYVLAARRRVAAQVAEVAGTLQLHGPLGVENNGIGGRLGQRGRGQQQQEKKLF
nr:hypothetical protein [Tanacetum cinerariifolium]